MPTKKKDAVPTIKPNSALTSWLVKETQKEDTTVTAATETPPVNEVVTTDQVEELIPPIDGGEVILPIAVVNESPRPVDKLETGGAVDQDLSAAPATQPVAVKKSRSKGERGAQETYSETFFKKPERIEMAAKPVRVSEESHWLLSVLVEEARRQGNKLTVGDLIENLLANHRDVHKEAVDELLQQWKIRKKIA